MSESPFTFVHSNRVERLADALAITLERVPEANPLASPCIVVPHAGLGRWLEQALAERMGIAFGLRFVLPGRFIWGLCDALLGASDATDSWEVGPLSLRILAQLDRSDEVAALGPIRSLLGSSNGSARVALALALSERFDRYLSHWPDLLRRWERSGTPEALPWQAQLWRVLRERSPGITRGERLERLQRELGKSGLDRPALPAAVHLFGLNLMPAPFWQVFEALVPHVPVIAYLPDPAAELSLEYGNSEDEDEDAGASGHALLDRLGAMQRGFLRLAFARELARDVRAIGAEPEQRHLLANLQRGLFWRDPARLNGSGTGGGDASLRIHACAGRWREVEVLRDVLLARFAGDSSLTLADVVVMVPDPAAYAPYFAGVFEHEDPRLRLAHRVVDVGAAQEGGLLHEFLELLNLPSLRVTLARVLALAGRAEVRSRLQLELPELHAVADWLRAAGVSWGLDRAERRAFAAGGDDDGTFADAARRLLLGYAHGADALEVAGVAPLPLAEGRGAEALGQMLALAERMSMLRDDLAGARRVEQWRTSLLSHFDALFAPADNEEFERTRARLAEALSALARDAALAAYTDAVPGEMLRGLLAERLEGDAGRLPSGIITVCGMVPLRSVPFRIVALLGLDQGVFPRRERQHAFECVPGRRLGERSVAADDRQAFLEALMAARDALHLSFNAIDPASGDALEPSPVLAELDQFLRSHAQAANPSAGDLPSWWIEHTTAAFEAAAFAPAARCRGYSRAWAETARALGSPRAEPRFATTAPTMEVEASIDLAELIRDLTDPARAWLRRAGISQREPEQDDWRESAAVRPLNAFRKRERAAWLLERYPALSGPALGRQLLSERGLPAGAAGVRWAAELAQAAEALRQAHTEWLPEAAPARRCEIDLACAGVRVTGAVGGLHGKRLLRLKFGRLRARAALAAWLEALALRASGVDVDDVVLLGCGETAEAMRLVPAADAARQFESLVTLAQRARREALPLFPESGAAYVRALRRGGDPSSALRSARVEWAGDDKRAGEGRFGGLALYTRDWADPLAAPFAELALQLHSPWLAAGAEVEA